MAVHNNNEAPRRRVVVTGIGCVTPIGNTPEEFWSSIKKGKSGAGRLSIIKSDDLKVKVSCEIKDFDPSEYISSKEKERQDRFTTYGYVGALQAMKDSGIEPGDVEPSRLSVRLGVGIGGFSTIEKSLGRLYEGLKLSPFTIPKIIANICPAHIAMKFHAHGPVYSIATACSSGTDALGISTRAIRNGESDVVIAGGAEACITNISLEAFHALKALSSHYNDDPEKASRPFDKDRDGFVMGEGSGVLVLEELEHARSHNAHIYAEVLGYGITNDGYHYTAPNPKMIEGIAAMKMALNEANIEPHEIDYINAHGTSTAINDRLETYAVKQVFGDYAYKLKISSTKSMHGHTIGATGGMEAIACILAIRDNFFPPTINLDNPDENCDLDYVPHKGVNGTINTAMSNSYGFGGHNSSLILRRWSGK